MGAEFLLVGAEMPLHVTSTFQPQLRLRKPRFFNLQCCGFASQRHGGLTAWRWRGNFHLNRINISSCNRNEKQQTEGGCWRGRVGNLCRWIIKNVKNFELPQKRENRKWRKNFSTKLGLMQLSYGDIGFHDFYGISNCNFVRFHCRLLLSILRVLLLLLSRSIRKLLLNKDREDL